MVAAAVHPHEIAASLETCGMSNSVVHKRFGQRDVFSLAEQLYALTRVPAGRRNQVAHKTSRRRARPWPRHRVRDADANVRRRRYRLTFLAFLVDRAPRPHLWVGFQPVSGLCGVLPGSRCPTGWRYSRMGAARRVGILHLPWFGWRCAPRWEHFRRTVRRGGVRVHDGGGGAGGAGRGAFDRSHARSGGARVAWSSLPESRS